MNYNKSAELYKKALKYIPGGVNSPVRAFKSVAMEPLFIEKAHGSRVYDRDGNEFIDYVSSWGPMILGHDDPEVREAVIKAMERGTSFGAPTALEVELAEYIVSYVPSIDKVRLVTSGTEATMSALRLARAYTGCERVIKFEGCYHGHCDSFLIKAGSGATTLGYPSSPGVTRGVAADTLLATFNDLDSVKALFKEHSGTIAAVIVEPVAGNMGIVTPQEGFLEGLRELCSKEKSLLIFDEVITGFRLANGGAQAHYGVTPDLTTLGKVIGGGFPTGAYGGKREIMEMVAPDGPVYQAGTLSGNPIAVTAGLTAIKKIINESVIDKINSRAAELAAGVEEIIEELSLPGCYNGIGSLGTLFFSEGPVTNYGEATKADTELYARYFRLMLEEGVYLAPSQFEAAFVSFAHSKKDIAITLEAMRRVLKKMF